MDQSWMLIGFSRHLESWIDLDDPSLRLRRTTFEWLLTRPDDPYDGVQREPGSPNLWFGPVPASEHADGQVVVCSYWIVERAHEVRCNSIATLSLPL